MVLLFKIKKSKSWHVSTNHRFGLCRNASISKGFEEGIVEPDKEYVEVIYDPVDLAEEVKSNLCKACVMQSYKEGLLEINFRIPRK